MQDNYDQNSINDNSQDSNRQLSILSSSDEQASPEQEDQNGSKKDSNEQSDNFKSDDDSDRDQKPDMLIIQEPQPDKPNQNRITSPFMTKYEKARIIGVRAVQISKNSPLYLTADSKSLSMWDPLTIAEKELAQQAIPFIIRRYLPDGTYEDWKLSELKTLD